MREITIQQVVDEPIIKMTNPETGFTVSELVSALSVLYSQGRNSLIESGKEFSLEDEYREFASLLNQKWPELKVNDSTAYLIGEAVLIGLSELKKNLSFLQDSEASESTSEPTP